MRKRSRREYFVCDEDLDKREGETLDSSLDEAYRPPAEVYKERLLNDDPLGDTKFFPDVIAEYRNLVARIRTTLARTATAGRCGELSPLVTALKERLPPTLREINKRYHRLVKIGEGSFGDVFIAYDTLESQYVTIKRHRLLLHEPHRTLRGVHNTILREILVMSRCNHKCIVPLIDYHFLEDGSCILVMPVVSHDLSALMKLWAQGKDPITQSSSSGAGVVPSGRMPIAYVKCITLQLLEGLEHLHNGGILHRDLKASNVMIHHDGTVMLIDFGWSRFRPMRQVVKSDRGGDTTKKSDAPGPTQGEVFMTGPPCTVNYRPPEILIGGTSCYDYGSSLDMWAVGCIVYELLCGELLVPGPQTDVEALEVLCDTLGMPPRFTSSTPSGDPKPSFYYDMSCGSGERIAVLKEKHAKRSVDAHVSLLSKLKSKKVDDKGAVDFLMKLLRWHPSERWSSAQAQRHPWLTEMEPRPCRKEDMVLPQTNTYRFLMRK